MISKLKNILEDDLILDTAVVFLGNSLVGFLNLIYHIIAVRILTPQDYGTFNSLISLIVFTSTAISPLGPTMVRYFTEYITKKNYFAFFTVFKKFVLRIGVISIFIFILSFSFSPSISKFLNVPSIYIIFCGGIIGLSLFAIPWLTVFQSLQKFKTYSFLNITSSLSKLMIGLLLMHLGFKVIGALSGFLAVPAITFLLSIPFFIRIIFSIKEKISSSPNNYTVSLLPIYKYFFPVSLSLFSFTVLTNIDVILVKHFFSPLEAGYYSIAQVVGKIFLFLPSSLAIVMFPKSTASYVTNKGSKRTLYKSLLLGAIMCGGGVILCFLFPDLALKFLTSQVNPLSRNLVGLFSLTMSFYALVWITINYFLATHNLKIVFPLFILALGETIFIYQWHTSLKNILYLLLFFSITSFVVTFVLASKGGKSAFSQRLYNGAIAK